MRSALGGGEGALMKLVHFRVLWAGEKKKNSKKGPQEKTPFVLGEGMGFSLGMLKK